MNEAQIEAVAMAIREGWATTPWDQASEEDKETDRQCAVNAVRAMERIRQAESTQ